MFEMLGLNAVLALRALTTGKFLPNMDYRHNAATQI